MATSTQNITDPRYFQSYQWSQNVKIPSLHHHLITNNQLVDRISLQITHMSTCIAPYWKAASITCQRQCKMKLDSLRQRRYFLRISFPRKGVNYQQELHGNKILAARKLKVRWSNAGGQVSTSHESH